MTSRDDKPMVQVDVGNEKKILSPEEVSAMVYQLKEELFCYYFF